MSLPETRLFIFSLPHPHGISGRAGASLFLGSPRVAVPGHKADT